MTFRPGGIPLDEILAGPRAVISNPVTQNAVPPIQIRRFARNGSIPSAELENLKAESLNQATVHRTKTYFEFVGFLGTGTVGVTADSTNVKWRSAFRTGPFCHAMYCSIVMAPPLPGATNEYAQVDIYSDATESTLVSSTKFNYGSNSSTTASWSWNQIRELNQMIALSPSTDYYVKISGANGGSFAGRLVSACAFELASLTEHNDGYLPQNLAAHQPIVDAYRGRQQSVLRQAWEGYGSKIFTWSVDPGANGRDGNGTGPGFDWLDTASATGTNILDAGAFDAKSTAVSVNTPGFYPNLTWHARKYQTSGVPCTFRAFGKTDPATASGGFVELKDSSGAVLATLSAFTPTPQWKSTTVNIPASAAKYDVHFRTASGTFYLWACVLYPTG
jgi:hypothetical protein